MLKLKFKWNLLKLNKRKGQGKAQGIKTKISTILNLKPYKKLIQSYIKSTNFGYSSKITRGYISAYTGYNIVW